MVSRWDGEAPIVMARQSELDDAYERAEKLRTAIVTQALCQSDGGAHATISFDVTAHQRGDTIDVMLARVDKALNRAKWEGRNCVRVANKHDFWLELVAVE